MNLIQQLLEIFQYTSRTIFCFPCLGYLRIIAARNCDSSEAKDVQIKQHNSLKHSNASIVPGSSVSRAFFKSNTTLSYNNLKKKKKTF